MKFSVYNPDDIRRSDEACRVAEEERLRQKCDHVGDWVQDHDSYFCAKCGQLMRSDEEIMSKIKAIEARIASLNLQFETMKAKLGEGPHVLALEEGTKMAVQELSERLVALRAGRPDPYE